MPPQKKISRKGYQTAKLTFFDWGWRDNVTYSAKAKPNEKQKGLAMLEKLKDFFGVNKYDEEEFREKMIQLQRDAFTPSEEPKKKETIKWTRDARGQIRSPFKKE